MPHGNIRRHMISEGFRNKPDRKDLPPQIVEFEGVEIQWNKGSWNFNNPEQGPISIDTYSIWNKEHWAEIAGRLKNGETCALYMMGNFGVARLYGSEDEGEDVILKDIKQREKINNLVAFANPDDIEDLIDFERLPEVFNNLHSSDARHALYKGPTHFIFPLRGDAGVHSAVVREEDASIAIFWIPGHWGYEGLTQSMKEQGAKGVIGGGSLNIHGAEPSYTADALREQFERIPEWQKHIDFVLLDELSEAAGIGRSHTQISVIEYPPKAIRIGSMSTGRIQRDTGFEIIVPENVKRASSLTEYGEDMDRLTDEKVEKVLAQMQRFGTRYITS